jgi:hypothetical protein
MDAFLTDAADLPYSDAPPVLLVASSDDAMSRGERTIAAAGLRIGAKLPINLAKERVRQQIATSALWVELDSDCGTPMDELFAQVSGDVAAGRYGAVVSTTAPLLDALFARIEEDSVELLVDADEAQRVATLAIAMTADLPPLSADTVRAVIRARRLRARYFPEELFADPAWDMLLDLLQAEIAQLRVPVSSLCIAAAVPATTALRWLKTLVSQGIFMRRADPHDGRRVFVELAPEASQALRRYFGEVGQVGVI